MILYSEEKKKYLAPEAEIEYFSITDSITTSQDKYEGEIDGFEVIEEYIDNNGYAIIVENEDGSVDAYAEIDPEIQY